MSHDRVPNLDAVIGRFHSWYSRFPRMSSVAVGVLLLVAVGKAHAAGEEAAAEMLFQQGRTLLDEGRVTEACPKFAESYRLEPATGTLLGLAMCHEREGKLATAWARYAEVRGRAARSGDAEREAFATTKVSQLQPRLSTLTLEVPEAVAATVGLEVRRNGTIVGQAAWGTPVPVDGGEHWIEATAPGKQSFREKIVVAPEGAVASITIEALADAPLTVVPVPENSSREDAGSRASWFESMTTPQWAGVGAASVGVVSLAVGGYYTSSALDADSRAKSECLGDACTDAGAALREQSVDDADVATVFSLAGLALVGTGAVLLFVVEDDAAEAGEPTTLSFAASANGFVAAISGSFE